jgi:hypothetical protein
MEYHGNLIALFQPHVTTKAEAVGSNMVPMEQTPQSIISGANSSLETLLRLYYIRHSFEESDLFLTYFLTFIGNMALEGVSNEEGLCLATTEALRATLVMCVDGLRSQGRGSQLPNIMYHTFINRMRQKDIGLLTNYPNATEDGKDEPLMTEYIEAQWPVPIVRARGGFDRVKLDSLIREYSKRALEAIDHGTDS